MDGEIRWPRESYREHVHTNPISRLGSPNCSGSNTDRAQHIAQCSVMLAPLSALCQCLPLSPSAVAAGLSAGCSSGPPPSVHSHRTGWRNGEKGKGIPHYDDYDDRAPLLRGGMLDGDIPVNPPLSTLHTNKKSLGMKRISGTKVLTAVGSNLRLAGQPSRRPI